MTNVDRSSNRTQADDENRIALLLRAGDPVTVEAEREEAALARIAAGIVAGTAAPSRSRWRFALPILIATSVVAVAWIVPGRLPAPESRIVEEAPIRPRLDPPAGGSPITAAETGVEARQIQFVTAGGTRVIWVLDPAFAF